MIHLIVHRIKHAQYAAQFLQLEKGSWRFIARVDDVIGVPARGSIFIRVEPPVGVPAEFDKERMGHIDVYLKSHHIQTIHYQLP